MSVKDIQTRIERLSAEIERQKDVLDQLEHSRSAAQRQLNAIRDPVARLPLEISSEIFLQCLSFSPKPSPRAAPMLLLNVCSAWSNIALSTPTLWAAISSSFPCDELLRIWLQRARGYPLSVALLGDVENDVCAIIGKYSKQLKHLEIFAEELDLDSFITIGPFPCLETLEIGNFAEVVSYDVSIPQIIDLLRLAPNLVECTLEYTFTSVNLDYGREENTILPNIRILKFGKTTDLNKVESHDGILQFISLPGLTTLFLSLEYIYARDFFLFLERSLPPLKRLGLGVGCFDCPFIELDRCLRLLPTLTHLELCLVPESFMDLLLTLASSSSDFLPNLHSLKIRYPIGIVPSEAAYQAILRALSNRRAQLRSFDHRGGGGSRAMAPLAQEVCNAFNQLRADGTEIYIGTDNCNFLDVSVGGL
ncbi:hypothetical protein C8F04DRAFT_1061786 [Mycena alexandri]|uniref:F-box domain-containing protein n=1 Tax=Mycena alexandri TaxID=1745969 RepID=A0AAD6TIM2_9AGAR|nr:hypothetical protein C8F04DRAFT_1061786 [Mycena alexandri]